MNYPTGAKPQAVVAADFNNDAVLDLAVANYGTWNGNAVTSSVGVLLGNADGTFQQTLTSAAGFWPRSLAVGDFNVDGILDLATGNSYGEYTSDGTVNVLLGINDGTGKGTGKFHTPTTWYIGELPASIAVGDFNGDGHLDLGVTGNNYWFDSRAHVLLGNGAGGFSAQNTTSLGDGSYISAAVADFNDDGIDDFATAHADSGTVRVLLGNTSGDLQPASDFNAGTYPWAVAAGDVNGDGHIDLVAAGDGSVGVLLGDGSGGFSGPNSYATGAWATSIVLGDFTHDGHLDVATTSYWSNVVGVLYGGGNGTFSPPVNSAAGANPWAVAAGDFNGDGWLDAAIANYSGNNVSVLINDHSWPPPDSESVSINDLTVTEGNTGSTNATFTVTLSAANNQDVTVHYQTANATATAGSDYQFLSGTLTFAPGETSKTITVLVNGDRASEPNETFVVNLTSPTNAIITDGQGVGTIADDEPFVRIGDVTRTEGNTGTTLFAFTVSLSAAYDAPVTVSFATADGTATAGGDYQATSGMLTIPSGQTSGTINVLVNGDRLAEPNESFAVNLSNPVNAGIADALGVGAIVDDEPRISIGDVTRTEGNAGQTTLFTFTVTLSAAYDQPVTVNYTTADGTATVSNNDYVAASGTLTFAPGETTKTITVVVKGDKKKESNETLYVLLSDPSDNALFLDAQGIGTILNDDR